MYTHLSISTMVVSVVMPVLATLAVVLRIQATSIKKQTLQADDYFIFATLIITLGLCAISIYGAAMAGVGVPFSVIAADRPLMIRFLKVIFAELLLYRVSVSLVKASVILFYKRIFVTRGFRIAANLTLGFTAIWMISFFFGYLFWVTPISAHWAPIGTRTSNRAATFKIIFGVTDMILDLFVLCLPLPVINRLNMSTRRKFIITGVFWLGSFCVVSSSVRLFYTIQFGKLNKEGNFPLFSPTVVYVVMWSCIEPCASIIAACLPTYGPLFASGKSPSSLSKSPSSFFSFFSRSSSRNLSSENGNSRDSLAATRGWRKLNNNNNAHRVEAQPVKMQDLETGKVRKMGEINVETSFTLEAS